MAFSYALLHNKKLWRHNDVVQGDAILRCFGAFVRRVTIFSLIHLTTYNNQEKGLTYSLICLIEEVLVLTHSCPHFRQIDHQVVSWEYDRPCNGGMEFPSHKLHSELYERFWLDVNPSRTADSLWPSNNIIKISPRGTIKCNIILIHWTTLSCTCM